MIPSGDTSDVARRFDGADLRAMFSAGTRLFEANVDAINALNVFPVPDGDTGTNMYLTLLEVSRQAEAITTTSASDVAAAMARGALMEARGNSGVILSQFFKGIATELDGKPDFGPIELASAFGLAKEHAYRAVAEPVEGTLLTVIGSAAEAARMSAESGSPLPVMLESVSNAARESVALTPTLLPILREAGVVDAGGMGLSVILEGVSLQVSGVEVVSRLVPPPAPLGVERHDGQVSQEFLQGIEEELYGYCTQFLITGDGLSLEGIREVMMALAQSTVVVGDGSMVKVHVHADDPGPAISAGAALGTLSQVKVENMDEQHRDYASARLLGSDAALPTSRIAIGVVAIAWGEGLEAVFADLGASSVLAAGDTMNPSIREILAAVDGVPADSVILLPNNRNILPAANQAVGESAKDLRVVSATTIPQGVAALLEFNPEIGMDENVSRMEQKLSSVQTGEVCRAVRPVSLNGIEVAQGQLIGLLERDLVVVGNNPTEVLMSLLRTAKVSGDALVTLYWGAHLTQQDADADGVTIESTFPGVEVEVVPGRQPHYDYILSIE